MKLPLVSDAEGLATVCHLLGTKLRSGSRQLHDHVGPLLSAAGLRLQMLRTDVPDAQAGIDEVTQILEQAIQRIRTVSRELHRSPADQIGLKNALFRFAEQNPWLSVSYSATAPVPSEDAAALYEGAMEAASAALRARASQVRISVSGKAGVRIRVTDNGRAKGRERALSVPRLLAQQAGLAFECTTGKSTIVSIRYAVRRTPRG
ncbi:MAG TPA: histidine kinase [Bryobacteraceae bacterium]|nr:histidine kinase [Bryobacteraceae bacterium]